MEFLCGLVNRQGIRETFEAGVTGILETGYLERQSRRLRTEEGVSRGTVGY